MSERDSLWNDITDQPAFSEEPIDAIDKHNYDKAWEWLQKIWDDKRVRSLDIMRMKPLLEAVYARGKIAGRNDAFMDITEQRRS